MTESLKSGARRRRIDRFGAAAMALVVMLLLGACKASGGGFIGAPLDGSGNAQFDGKAHFAFTFTCHVDRQDRAVIGGNITYHDNAGGFIGVPVDPTVPGGPVAPTEFSEIRLHGTVDATFVDISTCEQAAEDFPDGALFEGTYRPQGQSRRVSDDPSDGRFMIQVFDQGEPGRTKDPAFVTGDAFSIELVGGAYNGYTRAGYIEGGNIQAKG